MLAAARMTGTSREESRNEDGKRRVEFCFGSTDHELGASQRTDHLGKRVLGAHRSRGVVIRIVFFFSPLSRYQTGQDRFLFAGAWGAQTWGLGRAGWFSRGRGALPRRYLDRDRMAGDALVYRSDECSSTGLQRCMRTTCPGTWTQQTAQDDTESRRPRPACWNWAS